MEKSPILLASCEIVCVPFGEQFLTQWAGSTGFMLNGLQNTVSENIHRTLHFKWLDHEDIQIDTQKFTQRT